MSFIWTQSALKDFEREDVCPYKWKKKWIDKEIPSISNAAMDKGKYFEYLAIGAGARSGEDVTDLPRNKNGSKTVDQIRIEEQAEFCKELFNPKSDSFIGVEIVSVQEYLHNEDEGGTLDILGRRISNDKPVIIDLKLTADITNTRAYGWGNIYDVDFTQQKHYHNLFKNLYNQDPDTLVLVFDYSPNKGIKQIEVAITDGALNEVRERFIAAKSVAKQYDLVDWQVYDPSEKECESCPLKCDMRFNKPLIQKERIMI